MDVEGAAPLTRRAWRIVLAYTAGIVAGVAVAVFASATGAADNVYVMFAVLLVVMAALLGGTGPAITVAITAVVGDDLVLSGRLPPLEQWKDEVIFGTIAITVGVLVSAKRKQQLRAEDLARRERELRTERAAILATISHDVKNPLAVILGSARVALRERGADNNPRVFQRIESAALQAASLVDQLSDLHSLDGSGIALECRPADLRRTVEAAKDQMEAIARGHVLRYTAPSDSVMVDYDERRIQRVLQNLISNAIKYSPNGGDIDINVRPDGGNAAISIRDRGIGVPEAERGRVFERGYRANSVGAIPGTGLGLFISSEIVKRHGGSIACSAADGPGTVFEVRLPLARIRGAAERVQQLPGHRAGPAVTDRAVVHRDDRHQLPRRAREERLVRSE
jgi:signal transduction histidine kinase